MEAILEATARDTFGKNEARRTRAAGRVPAVVYGAPADGASREATADRRRAEGAAEDPALRVGRQHADLAEAGGRRRHARAGEGVPARSGHAPAAARRLLPRRDGPRAAASPMPVIVKGEPKGVKQQGGMLEFVRREIEIECLPADIPEHVEVDVSELMLHQGVRVRDIATNPKWKPVSDADMMLVHVIMPKAEEAAAPAEAAAAAPTATGRARSHQEGQEGRGRGRRRRTTRRSSATNAVR